MKSLVKFLLVLLVPFALAYIISYVFPIPAFSLKGEATVSYLSSLRMLAPFAYIVLQTISVLVIPIPSVILATAAGVVFGFWFAIPLTTLAWIIGTSLNFYIARVLGRPFLMKILKEKELKQVDHFAEKIGWKLIFLSWFIPGGTADLAGYAAGLTEMSYKKYFIPALVSAFLLAILTSFAGAAFKINPIFTTIFTVGAILGIIFGAKLLIIFTLINGYIKSRKRK